MKNSRGEVLRTLQPRNSENPNSFKVRRGKMGGNRDYLNDEEIAGIEQQVNVHLHPLFGVRGSTWSKVPSEADCE